MNFFNNKDKDKNEIPILNGSSFNKKTVKFPMSNLGKTSGNLMERFKNISKKDIAIVLAGLTILIMAPIAEYFLSKPSNDNLLTPGFGERKSSDSAGPNLYDSGVNALSSGSPDGSGEVITPLTARDPSSLIIGPQQSAPTPPVTPPPQTSLRDSMKDVAQKAASDAIKSSPAPFIPPKMNASLRGFSSFFSGGEGTRTSGNKLGADGKILAQAQTASKKTEKRSMVGPVAIPGYKGVAANTPTSAGGNLEKLKGQADKAANLFSGANAVKALEDAAKSSIMADKAEGGGSALFDGPKYDRTSGSNIRNSNSYSPGDPCAGSLENKLNCERAKKALEWEFFKKYEIPKQIMQAMVDGFIKKGLIDPLSRAIAGTVNELINPSPAPNPLMCVPPKTGNPDDCRKGKDYWDFKNAVPVNDFYTKTDQQVGGGIPPGYCCAYLKKSQLSSASGGSVSSGGNTEASQDPLTEAIKGNLQAYDQNLIELKKIHDKYYSGGVGSNKIVVSNDDIQKTQSLTKSTSELGKKIVQDINKKGENTYALGSKALEESKPSDDLLKEFDLTEKRLQLAKICLQNPNDKLCEPILPKQKFEMEVNGKKIVAERKEETQSSEDKQLVENALKGIGRLKYAVKTVNRACKDFTVQKNIYFYSQEINKYKQIGENLINSYSLISSMSQAEPTTFFNQYLSLDEQGNSGVNPAPGIPASDFSNIASIKNNSLRAAPISSYLIAPFLMSQMSDAQQVMSNSAFFRLVDYRGVKVNEFKSGKIPNDALKKYEQTKDSKLPGKTVNDKIQGYVSSNSSKWNPVEIMKTLKLCVETGNCENISFENPYVDENFTFKLQLKDEAQNQESKDLILVHNAFEFIDNDIKGLVAANGRYKSTVSQISDNLKKPALYFKRTDTNTWIYEILEGKWDAQLAGVTVPGTTTTSPVNTSPATTGPGTTSPGTTSPSTTGPGTTSPGTTGPSTTSPSNNIDSQKQIFISGAQEFLDKNRYDENKYLDLGKRCNKVGNPCGTKWKDPWISAGKNLEALKNQERKIKDIISKANKCSDKSCLDGLQTELNKAEAEYKKQLDAYNTNIAKAEAYADAYHPSSGVSLVSGASTFKYFDEKILQSQAKLKDIKLCASNDKCKIYYNGAENAIKDMRSVKQDFMSACPSKCKQSVITDYRNRFDAKLKVFEQNYQAAMKILKDEEKEKCFISKSGCASVSSVYLVQKWKIRKQDDKILGFIVPRSGAEGMAWDSIYNKYQGKLLTTQQRIAVCNEAWSGFGTQLRQWLNFSKVSTGKKNCNELWFDPVYTIAHNVSGKITSGNDIVRITATKTAGNNSYKVYNGSGQNLFNAALEITCDNSSGKWTISNLSVRIDRPVNYTQSTSYGLSLGFSKGVSAGANISSVTGISRYVPYGAWEKVQISNKLECGSLIDQIDK